MSTKCEVPVNESGSCSYNRLGECCHSLIAGSKEDCDRNSAVRSPDGTVRRLSEPGLAVAAASGGFGAVGQRATEKMVTLQTREVG